MGYADYFSNVFNKALAQPLGKNVQAPPRQYSSIRASVPATQRVVEGIRQGVIDLPSSVENPYEKVFGERATGGEGGGLISHILHGVAKENDKNTRAAVSALKAKQPEILEENRIAFAAALKELRDEDAETAKNAELEEYTKSGASPDEALLMYNSQHAKSISEQLGMGKDMGLGRLQQTLMGGIMGVTGGAGDAKAGISLDVPGLFKGAWHGLSSREPKYSGGGIVERLGGKLPLNVKRGAGATLDVFADPLDYVGIGLAKYIPESKKFMNLEEAINNAERVTVNSLDEAEQAGVDVARRSQSGSAMATGNMARQNIINQVVGDIGSQTLNVRKGGVSGRVSFGDRRSHAASVSQRAAETARRFKFENFDQFKDEYEKMVDDFLTNGTPIDQGRLASMRGIDKHFDDFINNLPNTMGRDRSKWRKAFADADEVVRRSFDKDTEQLAEILYKNIKDAYTHVPYVRVAGKQVKIPFIGKALNWAETKATGTGALGGIDEIRKLSHAGQFPGRLALLMQEGRAEGVNKMKDFEKEVAAFARDYRKKDHARITAAIENNLTLIHDPELKAAVDFIKREYDRIWDEEVAAGVRIDDPNAKLQNYTYVWNQSGAKAAVKRFKRDRKLQINAGKGAQNYNTAAAKAKKLRPIEDPFSALLSRQAKSNRDLAQARFRSDLVEQYGTSARNLPVDAAARRSLDQIPTEALSEHLRNAIDPDAGDKYYLPQHHAETLDNFKELARFDTNNPVVKILKKITNFFRAGATLYNPGYQVRNMISDVIMGLLDKVKFSTYGEFLAKMTLDRRYGERIPRIRFRDGAKFKIGDRVLSQDEFRELYHSRAAGGGFITANRPTSRLRKVASAISRGVTGASEVREDFPRMVHFLSAMRDEYKANLKAMGRSKADQAWEKAIEQSIYRVNHYKFDYGALTRWEQRTVKPIIPFYTFTRKAAPTLAESFLMNPKWLARYQRLRNARTAEDSENFQGYEVPQWMKDVGYFTMLDKEHPWVSTFDPLPTGALSNVIPPKKSLMGERGLAQNVLEQVNPLLQMPMELATQRQIFSGKPIDSSLEYILAKFGGPGTSAQSAYTSSQKGMAPWQIALTNRLGLGLPGRNIGEDIQVRQAKAWEDENIQEPFDKFNQGQGKDQKISIYPSIDYGPGGTSSYKVKDNITGKVLYQGIDPFTTLQIAKTLHGNKNVPMSIDDFNDTIGHEGHTYIYYSDRKDGSSYRVKDPRKDKVLFDSKSLTKAYEYANRRATEQAALKPPVQPPTYQEDIDRYLSRSG